MESFKASVQYGDWHGTAAADNVDIHREDVRRYLENKGLIKDNEFLIAVRLYLGETKSNELPEPSIHAYLLEGVEKYEVAQERLKKVESAEEPIAVREVAIEISLHDFFAMFKRFSLSLTWQDLPLTDREYRVTGE